MRGALLLGNLSWGAPAPVPDSSSLCSPCNAPPGMEGEGAMWEQAAAAHGTLKCFNV